MNQPDNQVQSEPKDDFAKQAERSQQGIIRETWDFLRFNKKWWLTPIILVLLLMGALILFGTAGPAAPFIYTLF